MVVVVEVDVVVIGVGVVGLMCVVMVVYQGYWVRVFDYVNKVGKKIFMFGGGWCNFINLNIILDYFVFVNFYFCKFVFKCYSFWYFVELVECYGIEYVEKVLGQLFCSEFFREIFDILFTECEWVGVEICLKIVIRWVEWVGDGFVFFIMVGVVKCCKLVVVCGGLFIFIMGVIGFGYQFVE